MVTTILTGRRILLEADNPGMGKLFPKLFFYFFRTRSEKFDIFATTGRTPQGNRLFRITVMTAQPVLLFMVDHSDITGVTLDNVAAFTAHDKRRKSTTIQQDNRLLLLLQRFLQEVCHGI